MNRLKKILLGIITPTFLSIIAFLSWSSPISGNERSNPADVSSLRINEFMADNVQTLPNPDDDGEFDDWIELFNAGPDPINLEGFYLTDDLADLTKHQITGTLVIQPNEYLLLYADNHSELGANHLEFKLSSGGESIGLVYTDGVTLLDSHTYMTATADVSIGRNVDGDWVDFPVPTPGQSNLISPPEISAVQRLPDMPQPNESIAITATAVSGSGGPITVSLIYRASFGPWQESVMVNTAGDQYSAEIPPQEQDILIDYYVQAEDDDGLVVRNPFSAPEALHQVVVGYQRPTVRLNEFMADNKSAYEDPAKLDSFPDWIELLNYGDEDVVLTGMQLTDNFTNKSKYTIPADTVLPPGETLVLFADNDPEEGLFHMPFSLEKGGEVIGLYDTAVRGNTLIDSVVFGPQSEDRSYVRCGEEHWRIGPASPLAANLCLDTYLPFAEN